MWPGNGWTADHTAERVLVDAKTVCRWMNELADIGKEKPLAVEPPVNKFPEFADRIAARMVVTLPRPTKRKIASRLGQSRVRKRPSMTLRKLPQESILLLM